MVYSLDGIDSRHRCTADFGGYGSRNDSGCICQDRKFCCHADRLAGGFGYLIERSFLVVWVGLGIVF